LYTFFCSTLLFYLISPINVREEREGKGMIYRMMGKFKSKHVRRGCIEGWRNLTGRERGGYLLRNSMKAVKFIY